MQWHKAEVLGWIEVSIMGITRSRRDHMPVIVIADKPVTETMRVEVLCPTKLTTGERLGAGSQLDVRRDLVLLKDPARR